MTNTKPAVVVVGSINIDLTAQVTKLPGRGETIMGGELLQAFGGKGANQAVAAARAGAKVCLLGCVGEDAEGEMYCAKLAEEGLDVSLIRTVPAVKTGTALIMVEKDSGENMIAVCPGANSAVSPANIKAAREIISCAKIICAQLEIPQDAVKTTAQIAREAGVPFLLNPSPVPPEGICEEILHNLTYLICNETEIGQIAKMIGATSADDAIGLLFNWGLKAVFITLGAQGCRVISQAEEFTQPGIKVTAVDAVGAGDAFTGAVCTALAEGSSLREAVKFGNAAGALAVQTAGAMPSLPQRKAIEELFNK